MTRTMGSMAPARLPAAAPGQPNAPFFFKSLKSPAFPSCPAAVELNVIKWSLVPDPVLHSPFRVRLDTVRLLREGLWFSFFFRFFLLLARPNHISFYNYTCSVSLL